MGFIKRSQYIHYGQKDDVKKMDLNSGIEEYTKEHELVTYFLPGEMDERFRYDVRKTGGHAPHFSRFKNSGYFNGYGMGHFNRYSTSEAEHGVGTHPKGVSPEEFYEEALLQGQNNVKSHFYELSRNARMNI